MKLSFYRPLVVVSLLLSVATQTVAASPSFVVSPGGSDDNPGTPAKPFATVAKARDAVRRMKAKKDGPIALER